VKVQVLSWAPSLLSTSLSISVKRSSPALKARHQPTAFGHTPVSPRYRVRCATPIQLSKNLAYLRRIFVALFFKVFTNHGSKNNGSDSACMGSIPISGRRDAEAARN
jgi:hypothetical protein